MRDRIARHRAERPREWLTVEEPLDILALERTREFKGLYHVLHGAISPMENVGPEDLKIRELLARLKEAKGLVA